jgi:hypothetical protein
MKMVITIALFANSIGFTYAQNVGIGTTTPNTSAILEISSTNKGLLAPRMTTAQRNAIASPAKGLLVYDTDLNALYHNNGSAWAAVGGTNILFSLPYVVEGFSLGNGATAFSISNTGSGNAIEASKTGAFKAAIEGRADGPTGIGARGSISATSGYGVYGTNPTGTAVNGLSTGSGAALKGVADNPLAEALLTNGNLRFYGGNTNPSEGALLTSFDAQGNAVWRARPKVAFRLQDVAFDQRFYFGGGTRRISFVNEAYDLAGNSQPTPASELASGNGSAFIAPVDGIYAFDYGFGVETGGTVFAEASLEVIRRMPTNAEEIVHTNDFLNRVQSGSYSNVSKLWMHGSVQVQLKANDMVYLRFTPGLSPNVPCVARYLEDLNFFSGSLVVRE